MGRCQQPEPGPPASFPSDCWLPPLPAEFSAGSHLLAGPLPLAPCAAPPRCSSGLAQGPAGDHLDDEQPAAAAAMDLGSLLGPIGNSWMGPLVSSATAQAAAAAGSQVVAPQKPFHMLFPVSG